MKETDQNILESDSYKQGQQIIKETEFYSSVKEIIIKKLQTGDVKSLLEYESLLKQFLQGNEREMTPSFDSRRDCELFELVADLFFVNFSKEGEESPYNVFKTANSKIPDFNFSDFIKPIPMFKILRRNPTTEPEVEPPKIISVFSAEEGIEKLKERQESYSKARALIFGDSVEEVKPQEESTPWPISEPIPQDVQSSKTAVEWDGGHSAEEYYNDNSAFVRCQRPSMSVRPEYSYYPQQPFYPQNVHRIPFHPQLFGQGYMGSQRIPYGLIQSPYQGMYGGPYPPTYPYPNMPYRPDLHNPGFILNNQGYPVRFQPTGMSADPYGGISTVSGQSMPPTSHSSTAKTRPHNRNN